MKKFSFKQQSISYRIVILCCFFIFFGSCKVIKKIADEYGDILTNATNDINQILDRATSDLNSNASNYGNIMQEAINSITDADIKAQLQDALDNAIVTTSTEIRCNIQFTGDYLIKRIRAIKAAYNNAPVPVEVPRFCTIIPSAINMNQPANQRNLVTLTGYFLNESFNKYRLVLYNKNGSTSNRTSSLSASTDFKLLINLGSGGITLNENSAKLVLLWNNNVLSEIPVLQRQPEPCRIREREFSGLPRMVLYPEHKRDPRINKKGDKEFQGHGPCTTGNVLIFTRNDGKELWARAFVRMWECPDDLTRSRSDHTYGDKTLEMKLVNADAGWRIKMIKEATSDNFQNIDRNADRTERISGSGPVSSYLIQGDTSGDDLGSSRVEISFKPIKVTLEEIGDCIRR